MGPEAMWARIPLGLSGMPLGGLQTWDRDFKRGCIRPPRAMRRGCLDGKVHVFLLVLPVVAQVQPGLLQGRQALSKEAATWALDAPGSTESVGGPKW